MRVPRKGIKVTAVYGNATSNPIGLPSDPDYYRAEDWQIVPWWHPRTWFCRNWLQGTLLRRWTWSPYDLGGEYDGQWQYREAIDVAHDNLRRAYGGE